MVSSNPPVAILVCVIHNANYIIYIVSTYVRVYMRMCACVCVVGIVRQFGEFSEYSELPEFSDNLGNCV